MSALGELQAALQEAKTEAATLRIENTRLTAERDWHKRQRDDAFARTKEVGETLSAKLKAALQANTPLLARVAALEKQLSEARNVANATVESGQLKFGAISMRHELRSLVGRIDATLGQPSGTSPAVTGTTSDKTPARKPHWPDCAMNHGGAACDMGPECGTPAPIAHAFLPAPFYPERCDARVEDDGKRRQCGQPRSEHQP